MSRSIDPMAQHKAGCGLSRRTPRPHRFDESAAGYSLAGCSPAEPASASPANLIMPPLGWIRYAFSVNCNPSLISWPRRRGPVHSRLASTLRTGRASLQVIRSVVLVGEVASFVVAFRYLPLADVSWHCRHHPGADGRSGGPRTAREGRDASLGSGRRGVSGCSGHHPAGRGRHGCHGSDPIAGRHLVGGLSDSGSSGQPNRPDGHDPGSTPGWWDWPSRASQPRFDGGPPMRRGGLCFCWSDC